MILGSLKPLHLFPYYQTREEYTEKTGRVCPPYDNTLPQKAWEDPIANTRPVDEDGNITYQSLATSLDGTPKLKDGKPYFKPFLCPQPFAGRVNIPPKAPGVTPDVVSPFISDMPMPMRQLTASEELVPDLFAKVILRQKGLPSAPTTPGAPAGPDRSGEILAKLEQIEDKLDFLTAALSAR